jgi:putative ABC transport system permease protein
MFSHCLRVAVRNLLNHPLNSTIKILGLALGLAGALLVMIVNYSELTWDSFWKDADQIYLVRGIVHINNRNQISDALSEANYPYLREVLANDLWMTQMEEGLTEVNVVTEKGENSDTKQINITRVDPDFLAIFQPRVVAGDAGDFWLREDVAVISQTTASELFGNENPLGKVLRFQLSPTMAQRESGEASSFHSVSIIAVVDIDNYRSRILPGLFFPELNHSAIPQDKSAYMYETYVKSRHHQSLMEITNKLNAAEEARLAGANQIAKVNRVDYSLMPIPERHMKDTSSQGIYQRLIVLTLLGLLILFMAIGNFTNLSLAGYVARQKEVALRRTHGGGVIQLIQQFLLENLLYIVVAVLLSLIMCELLLPYVSQLLKVPLAGGIFVSWGSAAICLCIVIITALIISLYPAVYFSRINPALILRANRSIETRMSIITRQLLLLIQFGALSALVLGLSAIHMQLGVLNEYQPGYKTKDILMLRDQANTSFTKIQRETFKQRLAHIPGFIAAASPVGDIPGRQEQIMDVSARVKDKTETIRVIFDWITDADYFSAYGIPLIAGKKDTITANLGKPMGSQNSDPSISAILCRSTAIKLGFPSPEEAIGNLVEVFKRPGAQKGMEVSIAAVIEDVHIGNHKQPRMDCMYLTLGSINPVGLPFAVNFDHAISDEELAVVKNAWQEMTGMPPHHWLFENSLRDRYSHEKVLQMFMSGFVLVALSIGLLGVYGMTALSTQKRAREIALRKLHGANTWEIIRLINRDFAKLVVIANLVAWPVAIYLITNWLENFHQHFSLSLWLPLFCSFALGLCLLVVWLTATAHSFTQGRLRPAEVLRDN